MRRDVFWIVLLFVLLIPSSSASLFSLGEAVAIPPNGCSIFGCIMQGDIDMNGFIIYNATFVNATIHEFDPVFTAWLSSTYVPENTSIWLAINSKLNITDQRYNDTALVNALNQSLTSRLDLKLNASDQRYNDTALIDAVNQSLSNYLLTTDQRYNETYLFDQLYLLLQNETQDRINNDSYIIGLIGNLTWSNVSINASQITNSPWVLKAGDNMTGDLNMTNRSIFGVDLLEVHNITGRSPIYINSDIISVNSINATTFYGNINGQNGTIYGMTIVNGTITNMHVSDSAIFNTSLLPELNDTWSLGNENLTWKDFYVGNLYAANITGGNIYQYFADGTWLFMQPGNATNTYIFYFNETLLNGTLSSYALNSSLANYYLVSNPAGFINESFANATYALNSSLANYYLASNPAGFINETFANATYLLITDQRYNDTQLIISVNDSFYAALGNETQGRLANDTYLYDLINATNASLANYYLNSNPQGFINESFANATYALNSSLADYALNSSLSNYYLNSNPQGFINDSFANATYLLITDQRYNETGLIISVNDTLYIFMNVTNLTFQSITSNFSYIYGLISNETDGRINNDTFLYGFINATNASLINYYPVSNPAGFINDTYLISVLMNYYNKTEVDSLIASVNQTTYINLTNNITNNITQIFNITQNITIINNITEYYNDSNLTSMIASVNTTSNIQSLGFNTTTQLENLFLLITDQRYNETQLILEVNGSFYAALANETEGRLGNDTYLYGLINATNASLANYYLNSNPQGFINGTYANATYALNSSLANYYLDSNPRGFINESFANATYALNSSLANYYLNSNPQGFINGTYANATYLLQGDQRYNETGLINAVNATIKQPEGPYLSWNSTSFSVNETALNSTINVIAKNRKVQLNLSCTAVAGACGVISGTNLTYLITNVKVTPTSLNNNYRFSLAEYPSLTSIDTDRTPHVGIWDIQKNYAINGQVVANITSANINELFNIQITYLTNGVS